MSPAELETGAEVHVGAVQDCVLEPSLKRWVGGGLHNQSLRLPGFAAAALI